jgi:hypothetical protein
MRGWPWSGGSCCYPKAVWPTIRTAPQATRVPAHISRSKERLFHPFDFARRLEVTPVKAPAG